MNFRLEKQGKHPPYFGISITTKDKFCFLIFYAWDEKKLEGKTREIFPRNDEDFLKWLFEFINVFNIQPIAQDEYIKERIENLIQKEGMAEKIKWDGKFSQSKEETENFKKTMASYKYTVEDIIQWVENYHPGFSTRTFRFYQSKGLIPKTKERKGKHKVYREQTIKDILRIIDLQAEGKTLKQIKEIMINDTK